MPIAEALSKLTAIECIKKWRGFTSSATKKYAQLGYQ